MKAAKVKVDTSDLTDPRIEIEGVDVTAMISRFTVDVRAGQIPVAYVEGVALSEVEGLANVIQVGDDREAVIAWLKNVDTDRLESEALEAVGLEGSAATVGEAIVKKLMEWASGD